MPRGDEARLWLYGVARRVLANHRRGDLRRTRLTGRLAEVLRTATPIDAPDARSAHLRAALEALPPAEREALTLAVWEGLRPAEIAAVTGERAGTVRVRLHRARARVRASLAASDDPPGARLSGLVPSRVP